MSTNFDDPFNLNSPTNFPLNILHSTPIDFFPIEEVIAEGSINVDPTINPNITVDLSVNPVSAANTNRTVIVDSSVNFNPTLLNYPNPSAINTPVNATQILPENDSSIYKLAVYSLVRLPGQSSVSQTNISNLVDLQVVNPNTIVSAVNNNYLFLSFFDFFK